MRGYTRAATTLPPTRPSDSALVAWRSWQVEEEKNAYREQCSALMEQCSALMEQLRASAGFDQPLPVLPAPRSAGGACAACAPCAPRAAARALTACGGAAATA